MEREGNGSDEDGGNAERQEGNLGGFHGACSWIMDVLVCEALGSQCEQSHATCAKRLSAECARVHCHRSATWVGSLLSSKQCDEDVKKNVEWASDAVFG